MVAAYALVLHEQLAEHPWLPGAIPHPIWRETERALGVPLVPLVSIARNQPWLELGRPLVCMLAISCGFLVGADAGRARQLIKIIAWSGAAYAAYGILAHLFDPAHILWRDKEAYLDSVTGTFINRNTAGAYFGSCAVVWSLLLWQRMRAEMPRGPLAVEGVLGAAVLAPAEKGRRGLCHAVSVPRGHVHDLARAARWCCRCWRLLWLSPRSSGATCRRRTGLITALGGGGAVALLLLQVMGAGVNGRFDIQGLADGGRLEIYRSTLRMIADHPWFGTGQGTFAYAFPAYRSSECLDVGVWDIAHNTLLEIAADMGVPIAALVVVAWIVIFAVLVHGIRVRRRGLIFPVAALAVAMLAVLHSTDRL